MNISHLTPGAFELKELTISDGVKLRSLTQAESVDLFRLTDRNRTYLRQWLPWLDASTELKDTEAFIAFSAIESLQGAGETFGIFLSTQLIGVCSLYKISKSNRSASIGYWISSEQAGKGYAKMATRRLLAYGFQNLGLHRLEIHCATKNLASQKVAEGCGLQLEGTLRQCEWLYDHFVDHQVYALLEPEFRTLSRQ